MISHIWFMSPRQSKIVYKEFISVCYITKRSHYTNLNRYGQIVPDLKASSCITCVNASSIGHDIYLTCIAILCHKDHVWPSSFMHKIFHNFKKNTYTHLLILAIYILRIVLWCTHYTTLQTRLIVMGHLTCAKQS